MSKYQFFLVYSCLLVCQLVDFALSMHDHTVVHTSNSACLDDLYLQCYLENEQWQRLTSYVTTIFFSSFAAHFLEHVPSAVILCIFELIVMPFNILICKYIIIFAALRSMVS